MATATPFSAIGAILVLATAAPAFAGGYWDGPASGPGAPPADYPAYRPSHCPPPPCQPCWRGGQTYEQEGWSEEVPPEEAGPPPEADYLEGGVGPEVVEVGGGGGGFVGGGFQPGLAIAAQFNFGERGFEHVGVSEHFSAYAHASAYAQAHQHVSYSASYGAMRGYGHMGYAHWGSYGHPMAYRPSYHPAMGGWRRR
jgi:hypothetical protein